MLRKIGVAIKLFNEGKIIIIRRKVHLYLNFQLILESFHMQKLMMNTRLCKMIVVLLPALPHYLTSFGSGLIRRAFLFGNTL